jgi:hypothetical protein
MLSYSVDCVTIGLKKLRSETSVCCAFRLARMNARITQPFRSRASSRHIPVKPSDNVNSFRGVE